MSSRNFGMEQGFAGWARRPGPRRMRYTRAENHHNTGDHHDKPSVHRQNRAVLIRCDQLAQEEGQVFARLHVDAVSEEHSGDDGNVAQQVPGHAERRWDDFSVRRVAASIYLARNPSQVCLCEAMLLGTFGKAQESQTVERSGGTYIYIHSRASRVLTNGCTE